MLLTWIEEDPVLVLSLIALLMVLGYVQDWQDRKRRKGGR